MMITLARRLRTNEHYSLLLRKARGLGLHGVEELIGLAIARGCRHYSGGPEPTPSMAVSDVDFSDEELAIALLSPCLPYNLRAVRIGAQMLGSHGNQPRRLAFLARQERAEAIVCHIAAAGRQTEPHESFWPELLGALAPGSSSDGDVPLGVLPHPSRFRSETGLTDPRDPTTQGGPSRTWLRPSPRRRLPHDE